MDNNINIFNSVKEDFCSLWTYKQRGNTLEIITPFSTTNSKLISVFLTKKGNEYIVTDGGWIMGGEYGITPDLDDDMFLRIYDHYLYYYEIKMLDQNKARYYYKSVNRTELLSSIIYDFGHFMLSILSASQIQFYDPKEKSERETFRIEANSFLTSFIGKNKILFNQELSPEYKNVRFNAIIAEGSRIKLIRYVTGSSYSYFLNSLTKATVDFEIANQSTFNQFIEQRVALINDSALGFVENNLIQYIQTLQNHTKRDVVKWSEKENLISILK